MSQKTRAPTGDFATSGGIAYSSGSTGYNLVNDYPDTADPLTSYIEIGTNPSSMIVFSFSALDVPAGSTINYVEVQYTDEEPSSGTNSSAARIRVNGTFYKGTDNSPSTTTTVQSGTNNRWTTNPNTSAAWTVADVNGSGAAPLQAFGVIGPDSNPVWRLGSVQLLVDYTDPINITTGTGSLTVAGVAPTYAAVANTGVSTVTGALVVAGQAPTVTQQKGYTTGVGTLSVTGQSPALTKQENIVTAVGTLSFGATEPTVSTSAASDRMRVSWLALKLPASANPNISTSVGQLTFAGQVPTVSFSVAITTDVGTLTFTGNAPSVSSTTSVSTDTGALAITGQSPSVSQQIGVSSSTGALVFTGNSPFVATNIGVSTDTGTLTFAGNAPVASVQVSVSSATGTLSITGQAPSITEQIGVTTEVGSLVFTGITPAVSVLSPGAYEPQTATLTLVGLEPTVSAQQKVSTDVGSVVLAGQAPSVSTGILVNTATGSVVLSGYSPTADILINILPGVGQIILEGYSPQVTGGESIPETAPSQQPAGRPSRSRRRRKPVIVEIDGKEFVVRSEAEAAELIDRAEEAARQVAESQAKEIVAKRTKKARKAPLNTSPLRLDEPVITVRPLNDGTIDPEWLRTVQAEADRISEAFRAVAQQYETAILLNHRLQLDEEDALVALLLTI